jgi:hypothetical protein
MVNGGHEIEQLGNALTSQATRNRKAVQFVSDRPGASFGMDGEPYFTDEGTVANEPKLSEATRGLLADMAALPQLGRTVALAPPSQRLEAFTAVACEAAELVVAGAIKRQDAIDQLMDVAWAHGCDPSHINTCEQVVRAAFANIGAWP